MSDNHAQGQLLLRLSPPAGRRICCRVNDVFGSFHPEVLKSSSANERRREVAAALMVPLALSDIMKTTSRYPAAALCLSFIPLFEIPAVENLLRDQAYLGCNFPVDRGLLELPMTVIRRRRFVNTR